MTTSQPERRVRICMKMNKTNVGHSFTHYHLGHFVCAFIWEERAAPELLREEEEEKKSRQKPTGIGMHLIVHICIIYIYDYTHSESARQERLVSFSNRKFKERVPIWCSKTEL